MIACLAKTVRNLKSTWMYDLIVFNGVVKKWNTSTQVEQLEGADERLLRRLKIVLDESVGRFSE